MLSIESKNGEVSIGIKGDIAELITDFVVATKGLVNALDDEKDKRFFKMALKEFFVPIVFAESDKEAVGVMNKLILAKLLEEVLGNGESEHQQD